MLDMDLNIKIDRNGVRFEVKKINPNNFVIDKVFRKLDKKLKKSENEKCEKPNNGLMKPSDCYTIEINV